MLEINPVQSTVVPNLDEFNELLATAQKLTDELRATIEKINSFKPKVSVD